MNNTLNKIILYTFSFNKKLTDKEIAKIPLPRGEFMEPRTYFEDIIIQGEDQTKIQGIIQTSLQEDQNKRLMMGLLGKIRNYIKNTDSTVELEYRIKDGKSRN